MKTRRSLCVLVMAVGLMVAAGCAGTPIKFGGNHPNFDPANVDFSLGREIEATASGFQLLVFIPIAVNSRHETAYRELREKAGKDYITNIRIEETWTYGFVGTFFTTTIRATAYPHRRVAKGIRYVNH
jgi:hypothetical protein